MEAVGYRGLLDSAQAAVLFERAYWNAAQRGCRGLYYIRLEEEKGEWTSNIYCDCPGP